MEMYLKRTSNLNKYIQQTMKEVEVKILGIDEKQIRRKLDSFAKKVSNALLTTVTFDNPHKDTLVRLRKINFETVFTVKVPVKYKKFKIRDEYETKVSDFDTFKKQLEILGFKPVMLQEKIRTTYKYKNSEIVIDKYPKMPAYIEIEGTMKEIREIVKKLGYTMKDTTSINVYGLFRKYKMTPDKLRFK